MGPRSVAPYGIGARGRHPGRPGLPSAGLLAAGLLTAGILTAGILTAGILTAGIHPGGLRIDGLRVDTLELRGVSELAELGGVAAEEQRDGPVDEQAQLALGSGHVRHVVGPRQEPCGEAAPADPQGARDGLMATEIDEHPERPVFESSHAATGAELGGDVAG